MIEPIMFSISAAIVLGGGLGVILSRNPVRAALSLIASFFGVAVLFVIQEAHFLAFVQVVVYAGAIVVLFLFVIMLLGVDKSEDIRVEPLVGQRPAGILLGIGLLALFMGGLFLSGPGGEKGAVALTGRQTLTSRPVTNPPPDNDQNATLNPADDNLAVATDERPPEDVEGLAADLFGRNILAFEATALLLTIATVGAVVLVKNKGAEDEVIDEPGTAAR